MNAAPVVVLCDSEAMVAKRKSLGQRSPLWLHFDQIETEDGKKIAKCKYCKAQYLKNGTGNMAHHIRTIHPNMGVQMKQHVSMKLMETKDSLQVAISQFSARLTILEVKKWIDQTNNN